MGSTTRNLSRAEFRCRCGCGLAEPHPLLVCGLQQMVDRSRWCRGIVINSGSRCSTWNKRVGGSPGSKHQVQADRDEYTLAADVRLIGVPLYDTVMAAMTVECFVKGGMGIYTTESGGFLHVDCRLVRATWGRIDGAAVTMSAAIVELTRGGVK